MQFLGIDVSKAKLDCLWLRDPETQKIKTKIFQNTPDGHKALIKWIKITIKAEPENVHIIMEATGVYHESLAHYLFEQGFSVSVVNPARPKAFAKGLGSVHKNDKKDSYILALYGCRIAPSFWKPEAPEIRELKALTSRLEAIECDLRREMNRLEKSEFSPVSELVIDSLNKMIKELKAEKKRLENEINDHIDKFPQLKKDRLLLESIPGIGPVVSRLMLMVIHSRDFKKASEVAAYLGVIPVHNESGVFKGCSRLSKAGSGKIRSKLYMAAIVAWKYNPDMISQKNRLIMNGKTKMQALGACMRKLVHICFGVIKNQTEYQPQVV